LSNDIDYKKLDNILIAIHTCTLNSLAAAPHVMVLYYMC